MGGGGACSIQPLTSVIRLYRAGKKIAGSVMVVAEDKKTRRLNKKTCVAHACWMSPTDNPQEELPAWKTSSGCVRMQTRTRRSRFSSFIKKGGFLCVEISACGLHANSHLLLFYTLQLQKSRPVHRAVSGLVRLRSLLTPPGAYDRCRSTKRTPAAKCGGTQTGRSDACMQSMHEVTRMHVFVRTSPPWAHPTAHLWQ